MERGKGGGLEVKGGGREVSVGEDNVACSLQ